MNKKGGLKLIHPEKKGFQPIYDMIRSPGSSFEVLTYSSLKAFMITLHVKTPNEESPDNFSEYLTLVGTKFCKPVESFILKLVIITPNNESDLTNFKDIRKASESNESYFEEAKLQQEIWRKSITGARPEICPPIANLSIFDNTDSTHLLHDLLNSNAVKNSLDKKRKDIDEIFQYILTDLEQDKSHGIGILVMPKVEHSETLDNFAYETPHDQDDIDDAYANIIAQTIRLFIDIGVIHFDLHLNNALIFSSQPSNDIKCILIDFGRASNLLSNESDEYFEVEDKKHILEDKNKYFNKFFDVNITNNDDDKIAFISDVMNYLKTIELGDINKETYSEVETEEGESEAEEEEEAEESEGEAEAEESEGEAEEQVFEMNQDSYPIKEYQMSWWENLPNDNEIPLKAFEILKNIMISISPRVSSTRLQTLQKKDALVNFDKPLSEFIVPFYPAMDIDDVPVPENNFTCTISGGKTKRRTRTIKLGKSETKRGTKKLGKRKTKRGTRPKKLGKRKRGTRKLGKKT